MICVDEASSSFWFFVKGVYS